MCDLRRNLERPSLGFCSARSAKAETRPFRGDEAIDLRSSGPIVELDENTVCRINRRVSAQIVNSQASRNFDSGKFSPHPILPVQVFCDPPDRRSLFLSESFC